MKDSCSREKCLRELDLNIHLYLTLNYVMYNVFVAFVGLNNNTISYAEYRIWIGLV